MPIAITRPPGASLARCELSFKEREPIDVTRARAQHAAYEATLTLLGATIVHLEDLSDHPDAVFVEDAGLALDELAIVTRPGAESRRGETASVARALEACRPTHCIRDPGTLDGGDVMRIGRTLYVGASARTNAAGIEALREIVAPFGYDVVAVPLTDCLHLKTACTYAGEGVVLANRAWAGVSLVRDVEILNVPAEEPWGASVLAIGGALVMPASFPRTRELLESRGYATRPVDLSELQKAEGGPTCLSIIV